MNESSSGAARIERVVPVPMESMGDEIECGHLGVGDCLPFRIDSTVQLTSHAQPGGGARGADQADDHRQTHERLGARAKAT